MVLKTERLILSPVETDKFDDVYHIFTNEIVRKYLCDDAVLSKEQVQSFIDTSNELFIEKKFGLWSLYTKASNEMVGLSGLWFFFEEKQPQLLYALLPQHTKLGYAKEASLAIIEYAFNQLRFPSLAASCDTPNSDSHKVALAIGMAKVKEEMIENKSITFYKIDRDEI